MEFERPERRPEPTHPGERRHRGRGRRWGGPDFGGERVAPPMMGRGPGSDRRGSGAGLDPAPPERPAPDAPERFRGRWNWSGRPAASGHGPGHDHGPGHHRRGPGGRAPRGNVRAAILALLAERPMHGYEIIQETMERTRGGWKPSPGAVYPALQQLERDGLIHAVETPPAEAGESDESGSGAGPGGGRRMFALTEAGQTAANQLQADRQPWDEFTPVVSAAEERLRSAMEQIGAATAQVAKVGTDEQAERAAALLTETRRRLYAILAEDAPTS